MSKTYISNQSISLSNGSKIPLVGLGTWQSTNEEVYNAVIKAFESGYTHIDTATLYGNEDVIGKAIKDSGIAREKLFVTTKLASVDHANPAKALETSLGKLGLEYVDLYLMHWPIALNPNGNHPSFPTLPDGNRDILLDWDITKTYKLMQELVTSGKTKAIGVSNFSITNLKKILNDPEITIKPAANQVELHPYLPQPKLVEFCQKNDIVVEAYSPLGSTDSPLLKDETLIKMAQKYGVHPATLLISWAVWRKTVVLPKSVTPERIASNIKIVDLSDEDGQALSDITKGKKPHRIVKPNWDPVVVFDSDE